MRRLSRRVDRLADPTPTPAERLMRTLDELPPASTPTIVLSVSGAGLALDLSVTTDIPRARDLIDGALAGLLD